MAVKFVDNLKRSIRYWLLRTLPPCQQTVETISQSMDRPLRLGERIKLKLHLWVCIWCQWYMDHLQLIRDASRAHGGEAIDEISGPTLSNEARERIRRSLTNQS